MKYSRYTWSFAAAAAVLTLGALAAYREISALSLGASQDAEIRWADDTLSLPQARRRSASAAPALPVSASALPASARPASVGTRPPSADSAYAAIAARDESWRRENAKQYTLDEIRVRGDGRRTPRQGMQDRVYAFTRRGDRARAIVELERWVDANGRDGDALLWLARLLNDAGRKKESIKRYRQALAVASSGNGR